MMQTLCWSSKATGQERVWRMAELKRKGVEQDKNEAAKLLQQFSGTPRFGKRRLHLRASLTEKASETQDIFSEFLLEVKREKEEATSRTSEKLFSSAEWYLPTWVVSRSDRRLWVSALHRKPRDVSVPCKLCNHWQCGRVKPQHRAQVCAGA